jgi:hypothetical protein
MNGPRTQSSASDIECKDTAYALPAFLCDDIMCCGVAVLLLDRLLDRLLDFGGSADTNTSDASSRSFW